MVRNDKLSGILRLSSLDFFNLGFRVDDCKSLLADGNSHNIWEVWL